MNPYTQEQPKQVSLHELPHGSLRCVAFPNAQRKSGFPQLGHGMLQATRVLEHESTASSTLCKSAIKGDQNPEGLGRTCPHEMPVECNDQFSDASCVSFEKSPMLSL